VDFIDPHDPGERPSGMTPPPHYQGYYGRPPPWHTGPEGRYESIFTLDFPGVIKRQFDAIVSRFRRNRPDE
jgi:hypothetical protein